MRRCPRPGHPATRGVPRGFDEPGPAIAHRGAAGNACQEARGSPTQDRSYRKRGMHADAAPGPFILWAGTAKDRVVEGEPAAGADRAEVGEPAAAGPVVPAPVAAGVGLGFRLAANVSGSDRSCRSWGHPPSPRLLTPFPLCLAWSSFGSSLAAFRHRRRSSSRSSCAFDILERPSSHDPSLLRTAAGRSFHPGRSGNATPRRPEDRSSTDVRLAVRASPDRARSLLTVRAAISSAVSSDRPRSFNPSLMCSY